MTAILDTREMWYSLLDGDLAARDRLVVQHLGLVYHSIRQVAISIPSDIEFDELVSVGTLGLLAAIDNFDPGLGHAFSTFAIPRIRGAILDELRRRDEVPRSVRRKHRELTRTRDELSRMLGRSPKDRETAARLGIDLETLRHWEIDTVAGGAVSLDTAASVDEEDAPAYIQPSEEPAIEEQLTREQEVALVRDALRNLTYQQRTVIALYYYEELKLHEIAATLGLSESRISQIRSKALGKLRAEVMPARA
ncbi:MAG TPA: FliA/WhiG family RNA polymerase sigma factor [Gemmatimonadaceae bacterium]|jgi:RNA polymerase sigma factor for flagellar operon FliA|nr:FliA/WhiG family RNA polymerase sigma factor [Gemmatimonadaceae bacterium]